MRPEGAGLILLNRGGLSGNPVRVREFHAPESRRRSEEFDAHALAFVRVVAEIDDAAFLLLLAERIREDEQRSHFQLLVEIDQAPVRIDDNRFRGGPEAAAPLILAREHYPNAHEDSGAASFAFVNGGGHSFHGQAGPGARQRRAEYACPREQLSARTSSQAGGSQWETVLPIWEREALNSVGSGVRLAARGLGS
jgi:hypothetical protein